VKRGEQMGGSVFSNLGRADRRMSGPGIEVLPMERVSVILGVVNGCDVC
jgi:hypothetical protein